jgi:hypothetical protein
MYFQKHTELCSVETTYGINSVILKLMMIFVENAETGQFLFLIMLNPHFFLLFLIDLPTA